jgi:DNA replication and repair protein RecF
VIIRELRAELWRNLEPLLLRPSEGLTVLFGSNGQGKTNVIEAIYFLASLRSFRTSRARELVRAGEQRPARLSGLVEGGGLVRQVEVEVADGARSATLDGKAVRGAAAIFGALSVVLFVPEDLLLPRAAPAARRKYLDLAVFNVDRTFFREASAFQRVLKSRNAVLRTGRLSPALVETYDEELARTGARVVTRRRALASTLAPRVAALFKELHGDLAVEVRYRSDPRVEAAGDEPAIRAALLEGLTRHREIDERRRFTGFGPQTDDLEIGLGGRPAREHASQGQLRSLVLALKLAELGNVAERRGDAPVLLLDDVPSELDPERRRFLFEMIGSLSCQTVISVADRDLVPPLGGRRDFRIADGRAVVFGADGGEEPA